MTISRPLQRKLFMQRGGEPQAEMMMPPPQQMMPPPQQMMPPPQQMMPPQQQMMPPQQQMMPPSPEDPTEVLFQEGQKIGQGIISQIDNSQDYEELMNALRGDEMPVESRREELSGLVGKQDSQDTPESVLTLVQPTMALIEAQGGIDGLMRQVSGDVPVEGDMAQGVGSMLMAGQPTEPVQMANGGMVRKMQSGSYGGANFVLGDSNEGPAGGIDAGGKATETLLSNQTPPKSLEEEFLKRRDLYRSVIPQETNLGQKAGIVGGLSLAMGDTTKPTSFGYDVAKAGLDAFSIANQGKESQRASEQATDLAALKSAEAIVNPTSAATKQVGYKVDERTGFLTITKLLPEGEFKTEFVRDPDTGEIILGTTAKGQALLDAKVRDAKLKEEAASTIFGEIQSTQGFQTNFRQALDVIEDAEDKGVTLQTGLFTRFLPALNSQTAQIRSIQQKLGLGVVGSVTFGALSKSELELALSTELNLTLKGDELKKDIQERIRVKGILLDELLARQARLADSSSMVEFREKENQEALRRMEIDRSFDKYRDIFATGGKDGKPIMFKGSSLNSTRWSRDLSANDRDLLLEIIEEANKGNE